MMRMTKRQERWLKVKTYNVKVNWEFEAEANSEEEAIKKVAEEINNNLGDIRAHADVEIEEVWNES